MEPLQTSDALPIKDLQLLAQYGISKQVQIRLVKLKLEGHKRVKEPDLRSGGVKPKENNSKSSRKDKQPDRIQKPLQRKYKSFTEQYLSHHHLQKTQTEETSYICKFCTKGCINMSGKNAHEKRCKNNPKYSDAKWLDENKRHKCHLCKFVSWNAANVRVHLSRHFGQKPFDCSLCTYKCSTQGDLNRHIFTHTREKPFKCLECDYLASSASNLKSHMKRRHSKDIRHDNFCCNFCPRRFYSKSNLYTHILSHTRETPFACQFCERGFNVNRNKNRHEKTCHKNPKQKDKNWVEEQKVFKCEYCQYSCIAKTTLDVHLRRHTGSKPFQCSQCSYRSASSAEVKVHSKRRHAEDNSFKCAHCNCGYMTCAVLKRHMTCCHNIIFG